MHLHDQPHPATTATEVSDSVPSGFRSIDGDASQRDGAVLMVEAYAAAWVILMGFVLAGVLKQRRLEDRIARLERALPRAIEERERFDRAP